MRSANISVWPALQLNLLERLSGPRPVTVRDYMAMWISTVSSNAFRASARVGQLVKVDYFRISLLRRSKIPPPGNSPTPTDGRRTEAAFISLLSLMTEWCS